MMAEIAIVAEGVEEEEKGKREEQQVEKQRGKGEEHQEEEQKT